MKSQDHKSVEPCQELTDSEKKKKNQRREDINVYITMATIVFLAAFVTVLKVMLQNVIFPKEDSNQQKNDTDLT